MIGFGKFITKHKNLIVLISVLLLIPAFFGYIHTRVNYDILSYLPEDIETVEGQQILVDDFKSGAFSMVVIEGMKDKDVSALKAKFEEIDGVSKVIWYDSILDLSVPKTMLPEKVLDAFTSGDCTLMAVMFEGSTASDDTLDAIAQMRKVADKQVFISGMSAINEDTKLLTEKETPLYVVIAVILSMIVLALTMNSFIVPFIFMASIGFAVVYNLGSNIMFGEISYITKALSAVLQLGVTMDYSIFLLHSYEENKERFPGDNNRAMSHAISNTISSVVGSSITTVAGFLALCFMSFTLGKDLGLVMAKGVVLGVVVCVTLLPSLVLLFDKAIEKTKHRELVPNLDGVSRFVTKHYIIFAVIFLILLVPAIYGNNHTKVYYDLTDSLPGTIDSIKANKKLQEEFNMNTTHMLLIKNDVSSKDYYEMMNKIRDLDGVSAVIGLDTFVGPAVPVSMLPESLTNAVKSDLYQLELISSEYKVASDEVNDQITKITDIVKSYSEDSLVVGEAPLTKDLIDITAVDFKNVSIVSIGVIFIIIMILFRSISLPIILVAVIEFAIFVNMGIPYYTNTTIPFIASVVIGTIQLGATVDYAILMTTRYKKERNKGKSKKESITIAHQVSIKSVIVSALCFFAATIGVGLCSDIDMISSLCSLMSRGALISMVIVIFILPSMFMIFDKVICKTSMKFGVKEN
ncbi:efflux RND transporter permease subunit [Anaerosporobacter faecicola]|uniref:efflux RND transporter permease subunit n=1 Tax=Anaerosporobacter faecicola TaxID=2718714 RepID=UPI001439F166|nr:MMPL family transporter [Anaerosporobacter faecicola]